MSDISNPSFEDQDPSGAPGLAEDWTPDNDAGAQDIATFEGSVPAAPHEDFEAGWQGGNQLTKQSFAEADLFPATFNDSTAEVEAFDYEWKRPVTDARILFSNAGRTAPAYLNPNDPFSVGSIYRDLDTGGRAFARTKVGANTVEFTFVDFVNPVEIVGAGFADGPPPPPAINAGHLLALLEQGVEVLGEGDGIDKSFGLSLPADIHAKQITRESTLKIFAVIAGSIVEVNDDGAGLLIGAALDPNFVSYINYVTGVGAVFFNVAPDAGTDVVATFDFGAQVTGRAATADDPRPFISVVTKLNPSDGHKIPPYNHSSIEEYQPDNLAQAEFGGVEQPETFESEWDAPLNSGGDNANSKTWFGPGNLAIGVFGGTEQAENFEQEWNLSFGGNENSQSAFNPADLSAATFDSGANAYEDFEGSWTSQVQI